MKLQEINESYQRIRERTENLCRSLETEDYVIQAMPDVSPVKWHLAHTTWFFESFVLERFLAGYLPVHTLYGHLFNSYYDLVGPQWKRTSRGLLSRPTVSMIYEYRSRVDESMNHLFERSEEEGSGELISLVLLGLNHEQQHQELLITDIKYNFSINPLRPVFSSVSKEMEASTPVELEWIDFPGGTYQIGYKGNGFCFDNELPVHEFLVQDFKLSNRLITCGEYLEFIRDGGYHTPEIWLADGWDRVQNENWEAPLYWEKVDGQWFQMTLSGYREVRNEEPVCHVSQFEADAFATWSGKRLPAEFEWEAAAESSLSSEASGNSSEINCFHPRPAQPQSGKLLQIWGDTWEWTSSAYLAYPRFSPSPGAVGEYNGKFMSGQIVLRGGSVATPKGHIRSTYRNFFQPEKKWQFTGIRLADSA